MGAAQHIQQLFHRQFPLQKSLYRKGKIHILTKKHTQSGALEAEPHRHHTAADKIVPASGIPAAADGLQGIVGVQIAAGGHRGQLSGRVGQASLPLQKGAQLLLAGLGQLFQHGGDDLLFVMGHHIIRQQRDEDIVYPLAGQLESLPGSADAAGGQLPPLVHPPGGSAELCQGQKECDLAAGNILHQSIQLIQQIVHGDISEQTLQHRFGVQRQIHPHGALQPGVLPLPQERGSAQQPCQIPVQGRPVAVEQGVRVAAVGQSYRQSRQRLQGTAFLHPVDQGPAVGGGETGGGRLQGIPVVFGDQLCLPGCQCVAAGQLLQQPGAGGGAFAEQNTRQHHPHVVPGSAAQSLGLFQYLGFGFGQCIEPFPAAEGTPALPGKIFGQHGRRRSLAHHRQTVLQQLSVPEYGVALERIDRRAFANGPEQPDAAVEHLPVGVVPGLFHKGLVGRAQMFRSGFQVLGAGLGQQAVVALIGQQIFLGQILVFFAEAQGVQKTPELVLSADLLYIHRAPPVCCSRQRRRMACSCSFSSQSSQYRARRQRVWVRGRSFL